MRAKDELTSEERAAFSALCAAAYPPEEAAAWPGRHLEWAAPDHRLLVWTESGELVCHAGLLLRDAQWNGQAVRIGGIGGVVTHPHWRRQGFATAAIRRAIEYFQAQPGLACGLLFCEPRLFPFYARLGWEVFRGQMLVRQHGAQVNFTFNQAMLYRLAPALPHGGQLDLLGAPW